MKLSKSLKKWTTGSRFGFKKASPLNPYTHAFFSAKKIFNGLRKGTWKGNIGKLMGSKRTVEPVSSAASAFQSVYGPSGSIVGRY